MWINAYDHMSGGVRALHVLKDELLERGVEAWMRYEGKWSDESIGVYPEITAENPDGYERFVRWKLNTASLPSDAPIYAWEEGMGNHPLLTVNTLEKGLWSPYTGQRSGVGYWVGKGQHDPSRLPEGAIEISRSNYTTRPELAERIRTFDYLISFDPFTAVILESVLSGTPVLIVGEHPHMSRQQITNHGWTPYGVAWSADELEEARREVHLAYDHYQSLLPVFAKRIDNFVEQTQSVFA